MKKNKACIVIISSRKKCIKHCLASLWENYNHLYNYPVFVHYFDDIYDDDQFIKDIADSCPQKVKFKAIPYSTPCFIKEEEMYYNKKNLWYVRNSFSINRKGYLHMCHFTSNMYGYENTEIDEYDYVITHDDESGYDLPLKFNPIEALDDTNVSIGAFFVGQRLKNGSPHQGHLDTRVGLWAFTKEFLISNRIIPKSQSLKRLLLDKNAAWNFHFLEWCDTYVIKTKVFETELWKNWITAVNKSGGIYKHRWGDNNIISIFAHIYQDEIYNFDLVHKGPHNQGKFRSLQDYAPSVKDNKK
tara:strand:+ start:4656 stop:5555 length:900 start_codon:yes stop_codon:yes gene_type:complete